MIKQATRADVHGAAKELHLLHRRQIVFDHEAEMPVLFDYLACASRLNGGSLADRFSSMHGSTLTSQEQSLLAALRAARFGLLLIESKGAKGLGSAQDIVESKLLLFADMGLWKPAQPGMEIASRVIELEEFCLLTGAALRYDQALLQRDEVKRAMTAAAGRPDDDRASNDMLARTLIHAAIRLEYTRLMRFE